jgi:hypothetical protein
VDYNRFCTVTLIYKVFSIKVMTSLHILEESAGAGAFTTNAVTVGGGGGGGTAAAVDESDTDVDPLPNGYRYVRIGQRGLILNHIETG